MKKHIILCLLLVGTLIFVGCSQKLKVTASDLSEEQLQEKVLSAIDPEKDDYLQGETSPEKLIQLESIEFQDMTGDGQDEIVGFYKLLNAPHVAGLDRRLVIVLDDGLKTLDQKTFAADQSTYTWMKQTDDKMCLLFSGTAINQGEETTIYELWGLDNGKLTTLALTLEKYAEIISSKIQLIEALGDDTPYPQIYATCQSLIAFKDYDKEKAIAEAADRYIEKKALVWYAGTKEITVTDHELEDYLDAQLEAFKSADDYDVQSAAYKKAGITPKQLYRGNVEFYRDQKIIEKLYGEHGDNKELISTAVSEYKKSDAYQKLLPALKASQESYDSGMGTDVKALKKADIFLR